MTQKEDNIRRITEFNVLFFMLNKKEQDTVLIYMNEP